MVGSGIAEGSGTDHEKDKYGVVTCKRGGQKGDHKECTKIGPHTISPALQNKRFLGEE